METLGPGQDRCAFVRSKCQEDGLIAYLAIYYCHVQPHGAFLTWVMVVSVGSARAVLPVWEGSAALPLQLLMSR